MKMLMLIVIFATIVSILSIVFVICYNLFQEYIIRINEAEIEIDAILRKRFDLLNKSNDVIKNFINCEESFDIVSEVRNKKLNNFEFDKKIKSSLNLFKNYKTESDNMIIDESFIKLDVALNETEAELVASRSYYNDVIVKYNKLVKSFPTNIIAVSCKYKTKNFFEQ